MHQITRLILSGLLITASSFAGSIIVDSDEWTMSDTGFANAGAANVNAYALNGAQFLAGGPNGGTTRIWIDSDNFGLNGSDLNNALTTLGGYTVTDSGFSAFTLADLQNYQAVYLGGDNLTAAETTALVDYVNGGGGVYVAAGTGSIAGGAAGEAGQWNAFLNSFWLNLSSPYNGIAGTIPVMNGSPILVGVLQLYYDNGNTVTSLGGEGEIVTATANGVGLIGAYVGNVTSTPEPATMILAITALAGLGVYRGKRRA